MHPLADRFPMLSEGEIAELAEDIKAHGLIHDIMIDGDVLIDGRNRRKACEIAGVKPRFRDFPWTGKPEDKDAAIVAYIISENVKRRHLNFGQRAILLALAYPEPTPGKRTDLLKISTGVQVDKSELSRARAICRWAPEEVENILNGGQEFDTTDLGADCRWPPEREAAMRQNWLPLNRDAREDDDLNMASFHTGIQRSGSARTSARRSRLAGVVSRPDARSAP